MHRDRCVLGPSERRSLALWRSELNAGTFGAANMSAVRLSIEPQFCGTVSVGTVRVIRLVSQHAHLALAEATGFVDRCVFDGETVSIPTPSPEDAASLVRALSSLPEVPKVDAFVVE
jgi:hypothetical protein